MNYRVLKRARVVISLLFLLITGWLFIDLGQLLPTSWYDKVTYLQFVPSLLQFLESPAFWLFGFMIILLLTFLAGRIYCSTICPLGILQDVVAFIARKWGRKKMRYKYNKPLTRVRYPILLLTILLMLSGSLFLLTLLDPYSAFGKIVHHIFRPLYVLGNNILAIGLETAGNYSVSRIEWKGFAFATMVFSLVLLVTIILMAYKHGRMYCNTLCPVGTFLGLISKVSLFRIRLDRLACNRCGKCSVVCKAECIDVKTRSVDFERCVGCLNCLTPCPDNGVNFEFAWVKQKDLENTPADKRSFLKSAGILFLSLFTFRLWGQEQEQEKPKKIPVQQNTEGMVPVPRENHSMPPGAVDRYSYTSQCTACQLCVSACPTQVLQPAVNELGFWFWMVPYMDYHTSFCNFECVRCTEVCPTGALNPLPLEEKKLTQLGKVKFIKQNCIVETDGTDCGACSEHCPTKAVNMVPYKTKLRLPEVNDEICIGCGACEYACPTDPKSIYVEGNREHVKAKPPPKEEVQKEIDYKEDFPF